MVKITLPDGSEQEHKSGTTPLEVATSISQGLARAVLAAKVDDELVDATKPITKDATLTLLTAKDKEGLEVLRHSCAHLLAHAIKRLYPNAKPTIGPAIEHGFYYDFDNLDIKDEDLKAIEDEMKKIAKEKHAVERIEHKNKAETKKAYNDNEYKLEIIEELDETSSYKQGDFQDLCRGPHTPSTGSFKDAGIKLYKLAGAYWRGKNENTMLTRIYGLCFATKKELKAHLEWREEARKRDHRKLGRELDLFTFSELVGSGLPLFTPRGTIIRSEIASFLDELQARQGYSKVTIPHITKKDLYETSGHWTKFKEELFRIKTREGHELAMKPMNCPHHTQIYKSKKRSYRELPQRYAEVTMVYRDEQSGELSGLTRVRSITQDDAHVFCRMSQVEDEAFRIWDIIDEFYKPFGMELITRFSRHDPKNMDSYLGTKKVWEEAEQQLKTLIQKRGVKYVDGPGEAAMYGPKIDFIAQDSLGREWQVGTIQLDFNLPERFDLSCTAEDGSAERIVMIHRAIAGSFERFMAVMIEHFAGKFPLWLAPEQARIVPVSDKHLSYAKKVEERLAKNGVRVLVDESSETVNKKIREAQLARVNYILVVGDKEVDAKTVTVRTRDERVHGARPVDELIKDLQQEIQERKLPDY